MKGFQLKLVLAISIVFVLTINGCQVGGSGAFVQGDTPEENNSGSTKKATTGDWLVLNLLSEPENLNPYISTSASATNIYSGYIYESFIQTERKPPWGEEPLLAEEMPEASEDHLQYNWKLKRNIHWQDGKPLTMLDAVFSLKAIMNPYVDDLPSKPYYAELDSLNMVDEFTLEMYCSKAYFRHIEFLGGFSVIPKHVFDVEGLMDDMTYFQVVRGSAYEKIADLLESETELSWDDLYPAVTLFSLENSLSSLTDDEIDWDEMTSEFSDWESLTATERLPLVMEYLKNHPNGAPAVRSATYNYTTTEQAVSVTELGAEIKRTAKGGDFPLLKELGEYCRDVHSRIQRFGEEFNLHPQNRAPTIGSGPFQFDHWDTGKEIVLTRYAEYWQGEGHAYLDKIIWRVLTDQTASLIALKNGEIDFMENLQTIQYLTMTNREKFLKSFIKSTYLVPSYSYLGWRNGHPIFQDKNVRMAMTHMVRRKDIAEKLFFGFAEIVTGNFYRYGADYDSTIVPWKYDPEKAIELLTNAGWKDVDDDGILEKDTLEFKFELLIPSGSPAAEQLASILREDLFMIGIEMEIRRLEWSVFIGNYIRNHNFDACYLGWVFGMKGDPKQVWHSESATGRGSNHVEFINAEADSLIDAARVEFDQEKRVKMYKRFQQILHDEQPYTFLFSSMRKPAYDRRFKNVRWYPFRPGYLLNEWFVPKDEQKFN
ncbi:MAG: hypothetical protein HN757_06910 [Calditrichaeota bacterium]|nr:hypothetical protein [Calditrichota bacterium]